MADKVTWFELPADDVTRASNFYSAAFGWTMSDMGNGSLMATSGLSDEQGTPAEAGSINGDISPRAEAFDKPLIVIQVDDINTKITMIEEAGGTVALPAQSIAGTTMIWAIVTDTEGNNIGLIQSS